MLKTWGSNMFENTKIKIIKFTKQEGDIIIIFLIFYTLVMLNFTVKQ